jgi:hypothetical protein
MNKAVKAVKSVILYHRSYRKLSGSLRISLLEFLLIALPLSLSIVFFYPDITRFVCGITQAVLAPFFPRDVLKIVQLPYIIGTASIIDLPSTYPSFFFSLANAFVYLVLLVLIPAIKKAKHIFIFVIVVSFINFVSSLYFLFSPYRFPYEAVDYSELYIKQQVSIWFFVPIIMGLAILPLPSTLISKGVTMLTTFFYSLIFGTLRYMVFLFVLTKASLLYMAMLFFVLGPLVDFIYIVGIYSVHVARLAKKMKGDFASWKWLY